MNIDVIHIARRMTVCEGVFLLRLENINVFGIMVLIDFLGFIFWCFGVLWVNLWNLCTFFFVDMPYYWDIWELRGVNCCCIFLDHSPVEVTIWWNNPTFGDNGHPPVNFRAVDEIFEFFRAPHSNCKALVYYCSNFVSHLLN